MNFSEFKKLLGADPLNRDPEVLAARQSGPEFEQAAAEAEAFEQKLQGALKFSVDNEDLLPDILTMATAQPRNAYRWMAMAASLVLAVGIASLAIYRATQPTTIEGYVTTHYQHDGPKLLARSSDDFDRSEVNRLMARFDATVGPELIGKVNFIKLCPTLHGKGAHMIVSSERGDVTVIYMPGTEVSEGQLVRFDDMQAEVIALGSGSAAIIGKAGQPTNDIQALLRNGITSTDA